MAHEFNFGALNVWFGRLGFEGLVWYIWLDRFGLTGLIGRYGLVCSFWDCLNKSLSF